MSGRYDEALNRGPKFQRLVVEAPGPATGVAALRRCRASETPQSVSAPASTSRQVIGSASRTAPASAAITGKASCALAALPAGALVFVLAQQYGTYTQRSTSAILASTVLSGLTLSVLFALIRPS